MKQHARWNRAILVAVLVIVALVAVPAVVVAKDSSSYDTSITVMNGLPVGPGFHWYSTRAPLIAFSYRSSASPPELLAVGGYQYWLWREGGGPAPDSMAYAPIVVPNGKVGPLTAQTVDMAGWVHRQTGSLPPDGIDAVEGRWTLAARTVAVETEGSQILSPYGEWREVGFGIDVTPPDPVVGLGVGANAQSVVAASVADIIWSDKNTNGTEYDRLSGNVLWAAKLNGVLLGTFSRLPSRGWVTIENLVPGANNVEIAAVDRAGNVGPYTSVTVYSIDGTAPKATVSASSSKRSITVKVRGLSEAANLQVTIDGVVQSAGSAVPGKSYAKKYSVPRRAGGPRTRKVKWSVKLTDSVGNVRTYSGKSTVTYYYLKKSAHNRVKAVVY